MSRFSVVAVTGCTVLGVLAALCLPIITFAANQPFQIVEVTPQNEEAEHSASEGKAASPLASPAVPGMELLASQGLLSEMEPNNDAANATPLGGSQVVAIGNIFPNADVDYWSFTAAAGDRVYVATQTSFSASASVDSQLAVIDTDGSSVLESDNDNGTFGSTSSSIAGLTIPAPGTYFVRVNHNLATAQIRPYHLHFRLQSGAPTPEVEPNDTVGTATPLPAGGWVSGVRDPGAAAELDFFSFSANAGDTVFLSLDLDPEDDDTAWDGRLGIGLFGAAANQILVTNDAGTSDTEPSEALFMTVLTGGTYYVLVDAPLATTGGPTATYNLSVSIHPATPATGSCTTYTSTDVPVVIPTGPGLVSSTITVPGNPRIADLDVAIQLNHSFMPDLDVHLRSAAGNDNGLFTDIGASVSANAVMDLGLDDEAGLPIGQFTVLAGMIYQPELNYRLHWFDGEDAGGTWTLDIRDDATGDGGTLTGWSLTICEPPPPPSCPAGYAETTVYSSDFESGDDGFTHSGVGDEWERGLPSFVPLTTCNSGTNCWVTDLDNSYNASSNQNLLSPNIDLSGLAAPVTVTWAQRYHMESATFDHYNVDLREAGGANPTRIFEFLDATMNNTVGNPSVTINESSGWSVITADASAYAGLTTELNFHVDTDTTVQLAGVAIDDVTVTACEQLTSDLSITKTDGTATAVPGASVTYTIAVTNPGPTNDPSVSVSDAFPGVLSCTYSSVAAGGATGNTANGAGNISDTLNMPAGSSVTYTADCDIDPAATGDLVNTASIMPSIVDPEPNNNSATDTDTLTPTADIGVTKTDGVTTAVPGQSVVYTIVVGNSGPSDDPSVTVTDVFPPALSCSFTSMAAGGATGNTAVAAGNIGDALNMPAGSSVTYTATCDIDPAAVGVLSNTATVTPSVTDPVAGNNSATDNNTVLDPMADLSITKEASPAEIEIGEELTYTISVTNNGPSDATMVEVVDNLDPSVMLQSANASQGGCVVAFPTVTCDLGTVPAGGMATVTIVVIPTEAGALANGASVQSAVTDPSPGNNDAVVTTSVGGDTASFLVTKDFDDDSPAEVEVHLDCNTGLPLHQQALVVDPASPHGPGGFTSVNFIVEAFESGAMDCAVYEAVPDGYAPSYAASGDSENNVDDGGCNFLAIEGSDANACAITNTLQPVDVVVNKQWIDDNPDFQLPQVVEVTLSCDSPISNGWFACGSNYCNTQFIAPANPGEWQVLPHYEGTHCSASEAPEAGVVTDQDDCVELLLLPGQGDECTIVNTRLYAGIPVLSRNGLILLTLLMLGVGALAYRRFA